MHLIRAQKFRLLARKFHRLDPAAATACYQPSRRAKCESSMPPLIRRATGEDTARIGAIARAAYAKYVPRIGREPAPMVADFAAEVAAGHVVVIGTAGAVDGYMIAWPEADAYLVDNITIDPARQGEGLGRQLMDHAVAEARRRRLSAIRLYTNAAMTENLSMYAHMGFVETHRAVEKGFNRVYMRWTLPGGEE
jgi:ribosomal protein S18 acetylase RimI-like enzyme